MDPIVTAALVGTAQRSADNTATAPEVDTLIAVLPAGEAERTLLLRAGAWAVYKQAGMIANEAIEAPAPALEEHLQPCSPAAADLLRQLIGGQNDELLPEALGRMRAAGLRLPFDLLPAALGTRTNEHRAALAPVLGERGRWLAQFNKAWAWVGQTLTDLSGALPDDAETIWQEGTAGQRVEVLRRLRAVDPAKAREWLEPVWRREKAEVRADLLGALEVGLGPDDEPLLEAALDDKAERVRTVAQPLLLRLPNSALAGRMRERAEAALTYANGKLDAAPLTAVDKGWARDGLTEKAPSGTGERGFWLGQVLERVPPAHWERRFGTTPEVLLAATANSKWRITIAESWTEAAERFGETAWAAPLWQFWRQATDKEVKQAQNSRDELLQQLLPLLPAAEREAVVLAVLAAPEAEKHLALDGLLDALPLPWSDAVGDAYFRGLRAFIATLTAKSKNAEPWDDTLTTAVGVGLPASCFAAALEPIEVPESNNWYMQNFRRQLDWLADVIRLRQRIYEEISL